MRRISSRWRFLTSRKSWLRFAKFLTCSFFCPLTTVYCLLIMATQVVMPKLSPTMEEGQLSRWLKKEGDKVSVGEPLAEIDTDKATMEAQALAEGVLRKVLVGEGETVPLGTVIAIIGTPDEDISSLVSQAS